jgi:hypothetical protein
MRVPNVLLAVACLLVGGALTVALMHPLAPLAALVTVGIWRMSR